MDAKKRRGSRGSFDNARRSFDFVRKSVVGWTEAEKKEAEELEKQAAAAEKAQRVAEEQRKNVEKWSKKATNEDVLSEMFAQAEDGPDTRVSEKELEAKRKAAAERAKMTVAEVARADSRAAAKSGWAHMKRASLVTGKAALALRQSLWTDDDDEES